VKKTVSAAFCALFTIICVLSVSLTVFAQEDKAMITENFNVDIKVSKDKVYDITTTIKVRFLEDRHGIIYYFPYKGEIAREINGKEVRNKYRNRISKINVEGYKYSASREAGNVVIKIGDENEYVKGLHTYVIHYRCTVPDDNIAEMDDFYWNIFPLDWPTTIKNAVVTVTMPKKFDASKMKFIGGSYGQVIENPMHYNTDGIKITSTLKKPLLPDEGVTLRITVPEGYFEGESTSTASLVLMIVMMAGSFAAIVVLWVKFGRSEKLIPVISFYPPKGMTSAETGYIIDGTVDNKDLISLLLYWASKGYIALYQTGKNNFDIIKLQNLPPNVRTYEKTMFRGLFKDRERVSTEELAYKFYNTLDVAKTMLIKHFTVKPSNRIYEKKSVIARYISSVLLIVPAAAYSLIGLYTIIADGIYFFAAIAALAALLICSGAIISLYDKRKAMKKLSYTVAMAGLAVVSAAAGIGLLALGYFVIKNLLLAVVAIALTGISITMSMGMKKRTKQSNAWMREILGLKNFIEAAELERLELLVEESPDYFYDVLPFAYVFGLTDKWAKKFENIALRQPEWYSASPGSMAAGYFNAMIFTNALNHGMASVRNSMEIRPAPKSGGGFSGGGMGGGGFSGGGFSGGGMGGGGGGSW